MATVKIEPKASVLTTPLGFAASKALIELDDCKNVEDLKELLRKFLTDIDQSEQRNMRGYYNG